MSTTVDVTQPADDSHLVIMPCHGCGDQYYVLYTCFKPDWVYCTGCRFERGLGQTHGYTMFGKWGQP